MADQVNIYERFAADPLHADIPYKVAVEHVESGCDCDPAAFHDFDCPNWPVYASTVAATGIRPTQFWEHCLWYEMRWVCQDYGRWAQLTPDMPPARDTPLFHVGGEINGPTHFCPREGKVVGPDG